MVTKLLCHVKFSTLPPVCIAVLLLVFTSHLHAELIFSAPPREDTQKDYETYAPLVEYLSYVIGERVVYEHPGGWAEYASNMRNGHYDIVFDGPHFSAWRMKNLSHVPVARLPGSLGFVVVAKKQGAHEIHKIRDLLSLKVCALVSPNLGTVTFYNLLANPVYEPRLYEVKGGFAKVFAALKEGKCDAAVLRDSFYNKIDPLEKQNLTIVTASKPVPNQTITVNQRLFKKKEMIAQKLVSPEGRKAAANLLRRFSANQESLRLTDVGEFENLDNLLTGVVFGW